MRMSINKKYASIFSKGKFASQVSHILEDMLFVYNKLINELEDAFGLDDVGEIYEEGYQYVFDGQIECSGKATITISNITEHEKFYELEIYDNLERNNGEFRIEKGRIQADINELIEKIQTNVSIYEDVETLEHYYDCDASLGGPFFGEAEDSTIRINGEELPSYIGLEIARELKSEQNPDPERIFWDVLIDNGAHEHEFEKEREIVFVLENKIYSIVASYCYCKHSDFRIRMYQPDVELSIGAQKMIDGKYKSIGSRWPGAKAKEEDFRKQLNLPGEEFDHFWSTVDVLENPDNFMFNEPRTKDVKSTTNKTVEKVRREHNTNIFDFIEDYNKKLPAWRGEEYTKKQLENLVSDIENIGQIIVDYDEDE
jgi:hypothetical protein